MARPLRIVFPGAVYHITSRGNERKAIFWDAQDHDAFLEILHHVITRYNWFCQILGQLASDRKTAEEAYRRFVEDGIAAESIWKDLKGQSILGGFGFVEKMSDHVKGKESIPEIPKGQRFINRPTIESLFTEEVLRDRRARDERVFEAVEKHGYTQREVADHLRLHFTSVSRIMRTRETMSTK